ncbi:MAG: hypothetical protein ACUVWK_05900 [Nitrososphaerales archaeon]
MREQRMEEKGKIVLSSLVGLSMALFLIIIMPPLSQEVAYQGEAFQIVPVVTEDRMTGDAGQIVDIVQPDSSYLVHSPALTNLALTLMLALVFSVIVFLSTKARTGQFKG